MRRDIGLFLSMCLLGLMPISLQPVTAKEQPKITELAISNPYSLQLNIELKCDWDSDIEEWGLHKFIEIPKKKVTTLQLPNRLKHCELWPKISF